MAKTIDGYHYAFLEPILKRYDTYQGQTFDVKPYTINSRESKRYLVGEIKNLEVIDNAQAEQAWETSRRTRRNLC